MKIGVVTFWHGNENYGMMLQCWALQEYLKEQGHDPFVIRCVPTIYKSQRKKFFEFFSGYLFLRYIYRKLMYLRDFKVISTQNNIIKQRGFEVFRKKNITLSKRFYTTLKQIQKNPPKADCYIVGSDQIWSLMLDNPNHQICYLNFGPKNIKRFSYAPSFGLSSYPTHLNNLLKDALSNLDAISVRENVGIDICKKVGYSAIKVLDPTLLLSKEHYLKLIDLKVKTLENYIFVYCLNISSSDDIRWGELSSLANLEQKKVIVTPGKGYLSSSELFSEDLVTYSYATISQWIENIRNSNLVVTTSFHGIVLSIILEKKFVFVPLQGPFAHTNNRVTDLLMDLHLEDRILTKENSYKELISLEINWSDVNHRLSKLKQCSKDFLRENLK